MCVRPVLPSGIRLFAVTAIATWLAGAQLAAQRVPWRVGDAGNGHSYEIVMGRVGWEQARDDAVRRGGYLATVTSAEEDQFIRDLLLDARGAPNMRYWHPGHQGRRFGPWIGGQQAPNTKAKDAGWSWVTEESFDYDGWLASQPDDYNGANETVMHYFMRTPDGPAGWNDTFPRMGSVKCYIVEYDANESKADETIAGGTPPPTPLSTAPPTRRSDNAPVVARRKRSQRPRHMSQRHRQAAEVPPAGCL